MKPLDCRVADEIVDVIRCHHCLQPLARTLRMVKRGTRYHKGSCANASRGVTWPEPKLRAHMQKMQAAAITGRRNAVVKRLRQLIGAEGDLALAARIWERGYKAGLRAKHYHRRCSST